MARTSLRRAEAEARSAQLIITKMIIDLDLTDPSAADFGSETTIHFDSSGPETFVDFRGTELLSVRLNGAELGHDGWQDGRIPLSGLEPTNTLVVARPDGVLVQWRRAASAHRPDRRADLPLCDVVPGRRARPGSPVSISRI